MRRQKPVKYTQKKNLHNMRKYNIDIVILIMGNRHNLYTHGKIINKNDQIYTNTRIYRNINRILITYNEKKTNNADDTPTPEQYVWKQKFTQKVQIKFL